MVARAVLALVGAATDAKIDFDSLKSGYFAAIGCDLKSGKSYRQTFID